MDALIAGLNYDTIYLDYQKAFDRCDQGIAAHSLRKFGFQGTLGCWLNDFMRDREQYVIANNAKSAPDKVRSGVAQGSVLGPLIFLLSVESITELDLDGDLGLFADDTRKGMAVGSEEDAIKVQCDLGVLGEWSGEKNMLFNNAKFEALKTGYNEDLKLQYNYLTPDM